MFIADYVLTGYGTGAIMAVPGEDERDLDFSARFGLPVIRTVGPPEDWAGGAWTGEGRKVNSASAARAERPGEGRGDRPASPGGCSRAGHGEATTTYKLRDWLFSRQRYWASRYRSSTTRTACRSPCPVMLPVPLPDVDDFSPKTFADDDADSDPSPRSLGPPTG